MSEGQPEEPVKRAEEPRQPQGEQEVPAEQPWSVPSSQSPRIELPETDFEPLRPLEPELGKAIAQSFAPQTPEFGEILLPDVGEETLRVPMSRPAVTPVGDMCPHGLAGMCIWCNLYPCDYMLKRALRFLLTKIEYGGEGNKLV